MLRRLLLKKHALNSNTQHLRGGFSAKKIRVPLHSVAAAVNVTNSSPCALFSTEASAVGFNDYEKGFKEDRLDVPTYFNFAEDVLEKWCLEEQVKFLPFPRSRLILLSFNFPS